MSAPVFPASWDKLNVVLGHDWLTGMRGGERVLELLGRGFPRAPLVTLLHNPNSVSDVINARPITTSWLQRVPGIFRHYRWFLPFFPGAVERLRVPEADVLLTTSHCAIKSVKPPRGMKHLCYCFTPMRYVWAFQDEYFGRGGMRRATLAPVLARLRDWDRRTAERVDRFVTLSRHVQERIRRAYGREADVVYPPVDTDFFTPGAPGHDGFDLIVSALVPYKRLDLAVSAYARLGYPLKVVGTGTELDTLRRLAGPATEFLGRRSDEDVRDLYRRCRCLLFPGEEDFGLVPVEAMACGKPVVAYARGGAAESVVDGVTGAFFHEQTEAALLAAVETCAARTWDASAPRAQAERFQPAHFLDGLDSCLQACRHEST